MSRPDLPDRVNFPHPKGKFAFLTEAFIREHYIQLTNHQSRYLRAVLPKGFYWLQTVKGGLIQWNWTLLQSYLLEEGTSAPSHQKLLEEYMSTLPQSA
jgi:hypothetical protein